MYTYLQCVSRSSGSTTTLDTLTQVPAMPNMDNPDHAMTVLPKAEWKRLRNKYLNLQRKHITHSKMKLHQYYEKQKEEEAKFEEQTKDSEGEY